MSGDCDDPDIVRLEYAPHHVGYELGDDGELRKTGHTELLDAAWDETDSYWCSNCDLEMDGEEAARLHATPDADAPDLMLVLDVEQNEGLTWLDRWGRVNDAHEPVVDEVYAGVVQCEGCSETKPCYLIEDSIQAVPVCADCLTGYDWVVEARKVWPSD